MLALADRLGCAALATGHYARVVDDGEGPAARRRPPTRAKDQTYMLSGLRPRSLARLRFPLAELDKPRGARARRRGGPRGRRQGREPGPLLSRRRGQALVPRPPRRAWANDPARSSTRAGRRRGAHRGQHDFTVGQRRGLGHRRRRAALRARRPTPRRTPSSSARARSSRADRVRVRGATLHRPGGPGRPGAACATTRARSPASSTTSRRASMPSSSSSSPSPPTASPRARPPACSRRPRRRPRRRSPERRGAPGPPRLACS